MLSVPGLVALKPFRQFSPQSQCVVRLDAAALGELERAGPHRLARLPAAATPQRRLEYLASRAAAHALLRAQGCAIAEVTSAADRAPRWPAGFTGSITHSPTLACVVVRPAAQCRSLGIDAQDLLDPRSADDVAMRCLRPGELQGSGQVTAMSQREQLTLLFSAKEAFFKCVYPLVGRPFGYLDAQVHALDEASGRLQVRIVDSPGPGLPAGFALAGSFHLAMGHAFTAFELPA